MRVWGVVVVGVGVGSARAVCGGSVRVRACVRVIQQREQSYYLLCVFFSVLIRPVQCGPS